VENTWSEAALAASAAWRLEAPEAEATRCAANAALWADCLSTFSSAEGLLCMQIMKVRWIATVNRSSFEATADNLWIGRRLLVWQLTPKRNLICKDGNL
jgi:hypothetical protein